SDLKEARPEMGDALDRSVLRDPAAKLLERAGEHERLHRQDADKSAFAHEVERTLDKAETRVAPTGVAALQFRHSFGRQIPRRKIMGIRAHSVERVSIFVYT